MTPSAGSRRGGPRSAPARELNQPPPHVPDMPRRIADFHRRRVCRRTRSCVCHETGGFSRPGANFLACQREAEEIRMHFSGCEHRLHASGRGPRHAHDAGARVLLRRARGPLEHAHDHDPELRVDGHHDRACGGSSATPSASAAARTGSSGTSTTRSSATSASHAIYAPYGIPALGVHRLPDDVRDHHARADHGRVHEPRHVQGVPHLPRRLAASRLLPVRPHALGRRPARRSGARATSPAGSSCTRAPGSPALASVIYLGKRRFVDTPHNIPFIALGTGPPVVRLVRLQRRQRAAGRPHHGARVPQHRPRRLVRRGHLAVRRVVVREEAALRRAADRRRRGSGDDHAGRRFCADLRRRRSSASRPARLLRRDPAEEHAASGTTRSTSGACTASAACSGSSSSASSAACRSTRTAAPA